MFCVESIVDLSKTLKGAPAAAASGGAACGPFATGTRAAAVVAAKLDADIFCLFLPRLAYDAADLRTPLPVAAADVAAPTANRGSGVLADADADRPPTAPKLPLRVPRLSSRQDFFWRLPLLSCACGAHVGRTESISSAIHGRRHVSSISRRYGFRGAEVEERSKVSPQRRTRLFKSACTWVMMRGLLTTFLPALARKKAFRMGCCRPPFEHAGQGRKGRLTSARHLEHEGREGGNVRRLAHEIS